MTDAPTPDEVVDDINQGSPPKSLGDTAREHDDPELAQNADIDPNPQHVQEET